MSYDDIHALIDAPAGDGAPPLARFEEMLTTGYARALALETERRRLKRRMAEVSQQAGNGHSHGELTSLGELLASADRELMRLRGLLAALKARTREVRVAQKTLS